MPDATARPVVSGLRWARWAVLSGAAILAAVLVLTGLANYRGVRAATRELGEGEAILVAQDLLDDIRRLRRRADADDLATWVEENRDRGVRYAAIGGPQGLTEAGEPALRANELAGPPAPISSTWLGDRVRVTLRPPQPPDRPPGPPPGRDMRPPGSPPDRPPPGGGPDRRPPDGPPNMSEPGGGPGMGPRGPRRPGLPGAIVELVPVRLNALMDRARRDLGINLGVSGALVLAGLFAFRWLRGREAREVARAREVELARLGEMSAVLAHEIRNPLASLKGHAQLLVESTDEDSRERVKAERIVDEAVRIERLSTELLDLVRTGSVERQPCAPLTLARECADSIGDERIEVVDRGAPPSWRLDPLRMRQVLTNLLSNALDASGDDRPVDLTVSQRGDRLVFEVRDRGPGIAADALERVFEPFHTTRTRGTGLGLAVARRIVSLHGGTLVAGNHPEGGAVLTATLPPNEA